MAGNPDAERRLGARLGSRRERRRAQRRGLNRSGTLPNARAGVSSKNGDKARPPCPPPPGRWRRRPDDAHRCLLSRALRIRRSASSPRHLEGLRSLAEPARPRPSNSARPCRTTACGVRFVATGTAHARSRTRSWCGTRSQHRPNRPGTALCATTDRAEPGGSDVPVDGQAVFHGRSFKTWSRLSAMSSSWRATACE